MTIERGLLIVISGPNQEAVLHALNGLGLQLSTGIATTSVIGVLDGDQPGPTTLLRAASFWQIGFAARSFAAIPGSRPRVQGER